MVVEKKRKHTHTKRRQNRESFSPATSQSAIAGFLASGSGQAAGNLHVSGVFLRRTSVPLQHPSGEHDGHAR